MTITEHAAAALARARATGTPMPPAVESAHVRRVRAAMAREVAAMLGVPPTHVVVTSDPLRGYGGLPGHLITVHDPDDPATVYRFVPETGNTGGGGGAYLLLGDCPGCGGRADDGLGGAEALVPIACIAGLADLGLYLEQARPAGPGHPDPDDNGNPEPPVEFFDDPGHLPKCPLR